MSDIIQEYGNEYEVVIAYKPDEELVERCNKEGHDMVRTKIEKTREKVESFDDTCKVCGLGHWCNLIEDDYNKGWIVNYNKFDFAVNTALKNSRPVYYETEIPSSSIYPSQKCDEHQYDDDYAYVIENGQPSTDSIIVKHNFKIQYKVGKCHCNHEYVIITPINVKSNKVICLKEKDFSKEWKSFTVKRLTILEKKIPSLPKMC